MRSRTPFDGVLPCFAWIDKIIEDEWLCYDITSISSYSELNEYIRYGYNRDREQLPQLNLAIFFGQQSGLPAYYQRLPGNITDVQTLHNLLATFQKLEEKSSPLCSIRAPIGRRTSTNS
ncbi:MAG TPA: hypothetical protein PK712_00810 [Rectinema sp.]|nr:hypothetical protein [Spirochaetota bacterium]HNT59909.1 hypothetical protein [Rectinema sp.]HPN02799.1 hypothetical protein [Rectinema sp.]HPW46881.1 hypothetical protein [Rectinema sp.]HQB06362.1 hypothetical protein [Rectinema sp.]